jgi:4-hydroxy-2-oxoheptanedioate aldolase
LQILSTRSEGLVSLHEIGRLHRVRSIIVEGERGLENLDAIITIEHLDLIYLGVYDISQSLGIPGKVRDPRVRAYLTRYAERIRESGKAAGTLAQNVEEIQELHQMGFNFIAYKADCALLTDACASIMKSDRSPASVEE